MKISSKDKAKLLISEFAEFSQWDSQGSKHYLTFIDKNTQDTVTLIKYPAGELTTNRQNGDWHENGETTVDTERCISLIWEKRASINRAIAMSK